MAMIYICKHQTRIAYTHNTPPTAHMHKHTQPTAHQLTLIRPLSTLPSFPTGNTKALNFLYRFFGVGVAGAVASASPSLIFAWAYTLPCGNPAVVRAAERAASDGERSRHSKAGAEENSDEFSLRDTTPCVWSSSPSCLSLDLSWGFLSGV